MAESALKRLAGMSKPGRWVIDALEGAQASAGTGRFDPGAFHPSDFGNECDAALAFKFLGAPAVSIIVARTQRIFDLGNARDLQLKKDMKKAGLSIIRREEDRKIVIPSLFIRGELDDWIENPITKRRYIVDYKTMNPREFGDLKAIKPVHHLQIHPYMVAKETYEGFVLYENKADQEFKLWPGNFDNGIWKNMFVDRVERIMTGLEQNLVYRNPLHCSSCPFSANGVCTTRSIEGLKERSGLWNQSSSTTTTSNLGV